MFNYDAENSEYSSLEECVNDVYELASRYAKEGVKNNIGGPFGAGIILKKDNDKYIVLAIDRNTVLKTEDPTAHAEVNVIRKTCKILNTRSLENCILVTTGKSCPMCLAAACWAKIKTIYYSEDYSHASSSGFKDNNILEYLNNQNSDLIEEINLINDICLEPFKEWNNKKDKTPY